MFNQFSFDNLDARKLTLIMADPEEVIRKNKLHNERLEKWVKYKNIWYDPLEWYILARANNYSSTFGEYCDIEEVLKMAQDTISRLAKEDKDIIGLLARYFEFEQRVRKYYLQKINLNKRALTDF